MDLLGSLFQALTNLGGGSELIPLLVFCVFLVVVGLGIGLGVMRLIPRSGTTSEAGADQST